MVLAYSTCGITILFLLLTTCYVVPSKPRLLILELHTQASFFDSIVNTRWLPPLTRILPLLKLSDLMTSLLDYWSCSDTSLDFKSDSRVRRPYFYPLMGIESIHIVYFFRLSSSETGSSSWSLGHGVRSPIDVGAIKLIYLCTEVTYAATSMFLRAILSWGITSFFFPCKVHLKFDLLPWLYPPGHNSPRWLYFKQFEARCWPTLKLAFMMNLTVWGWPQKFLLTFSCTDVLASIVQHCLCLSELMHLLPCMTFWSFLLFVE